MRAYNFGARGSDLTKLFHVTCRKTGIIISVHVLVDHTSKIWEDKNSPTLGAIFDNFRIRSRISPERMAISKIGNEGDQQRSLSRWTKMPW